jgi:hypothetical protein
VELALVELGADLAAVRDVDRHETHAAALRSEHTRVALIRIHVRIAEPVRRCCDADARQDRDAIPLALAVMHRLVTECGEGECRKGFVGGLRFLEAQDVDVGVREEFLDAREPGFQ